MSVPLPLLLSACLAFRRAVRFDQPCDARAAAEAQRFIYLTTGALPELVSGAGEAYDEEVLLLHPAHPRAAGLGAAAADHAVHTAGGAVLLLGATAEARLRAAVAFGEALGMFFDVYGDVAPDPTAKGGCPWRGRGRRLCPSCTSARGRRRLRTGACSRFTIFRRAPTGGTWRRTSTSSRRRPSRR